MCVGMHVEGKQGSLTRTGSEKPQWDGRCLCVWGRTQDRTPTWWAGPKLMVRGERARSQRCQHSDSDDVRSIRLQFCQQDPGF